MKLKHWGLMFLIMLVYAIVLILIAFCIEGLRTVDGLKYTLSSDGQSYYVSGYFKYLQPKKVVVRSDYKGLPVTGIGEKAFYSNNPFIGYHLPFSNGATCCAGQNNRKISGENSTTARAVYGK